MPEPTPPPDAGGAFGRREGPLTPDAIDAVLADFRRWLEELAAGGAEPPPEPEEPGVDLATLVGAFTALRHEVNLQTKAARAQSEQLAQALDALQPPATPADDPDTRPLVKALAEVYDTLTRAAKEIDQLRQGVSGLFSGPKDWPGTDVTATVPEFSPSRPTFLERLFSLGVVRRRWESEEQFVRLLRAAREVDRSRHEQVRLEWGRRWAEVEGVLDRLGATATGLRMSERRVERLMREVGLEPIESVGRPFDPEAMEAVDAVADSGQPSGAVVEELRRGYRWRGRVFRYAQVRVAK